MSENVDLITTSIEPFIKRLEKKMVNVSIWGLLVGAVLLTLTAISVDRRISKWEQRLDRAWAVDDARDFGQQLLMSNLDLHAERSLSVPDSRAIYERRLAAERN